jgi:hypothetical protein
MNIRIVTLLLSLLLIAGCSTNYRYTSAGKITLPDNSEQNAVLYWDNLLGRTWYGKSVDIYASDINLKVCAVGTYVFNTNLKDALFYPAKGGDLLTHVINEQKQFEAKEPPTRVHDGHECGVVQVNNEGVKPRDIKLGKQPSISIFCASDVEARYPKAGQYVFKPVTRREIAEGTSTKEPLVCE